MYTNIRHGCEAVTIATCIGSIPQIIYPDHVKSHIIAQYTLSNKSANQF